jgi:hypothetical protein
MTADAAAADPCVVGVDYGTLSGLANGETAKAPASQAQGPQDIGGSGPSGSGVSPRGTVLPRANGAQP